MSLLEAQRTSTRPDIERAADFGVTAMRARALLARFGCVLIRNAIAPQKLALYRTKIDNAFRAAVVEATLNGHDLLGPDALHDTGLWQLRLGHLWHDRFAAANPGFSLFDLTADLEFFFLLTNWLGGVFLPFNVTHARHMAPRRSPGVGLDEPLPFHLDAEHHEPRDFVTNFWIPFDPCGSDRPGLQVALASPDLIQNLVKFDPERLTADRAVIRKLAEDPASLLGPDAIWQPHFEVGDVMVLTNWTVHATYATEAMTQPRLSVEVRYCRTGPLPPR